MQPIKQNFLWITFWYEGDDAGRAAGSWGCRKEMEQKWQKTGEFAEFVSCILDPGLQSQETESAENWEKLQEFAEFVPRAPGASCRGPGPRLKVAIKGVREFKSLRV
tara:strand:+ start:37 stop:357 length:321 start_codon:yes stop_codon:yes gene_type:complete